MKKVVIFITMALVALPSCNLLFNCIDGNGDLKTEERAAGPFTAVSNTTSFQVIYVKSDEYSVTVEAESNIIPYIETDISRESLEVRTIRGSHCLRYTIRPVITVTAPFITDLVSSGSGDVVADSLEGEEIGIVSTGSGDILTGGISASDLSIMISGSGDVTTGQIDANTFAFTLTGSGDLDAIGEAPGGKYIISGSGCIYAEELTTGNAQMTISGSGSAYATVTVSLNATLSGSGNIYLYGDPDVNLVRTGSGVIIYR
jgi:hypothetical protein